MSECIVCGKPALGASRHCRDHLPADATMELSDADISVIRGDPAESRTVSEGSGPAPKDTSHAGRLVGRSMGGRFELKSFLGSGGFGSTYVAHDSRLRRDCVVKLLHPASNPPSTIELEMRRRFKNEALALAHLVHANVVQAFDHGEEPDGTCWIAMEYAKGRPLGDVLQETRQLPVTRAALVAQQVAAALAFAHGRGIVHRDLKPDNVILVEGASSGEQVKVLDFGIARITDPSQLGLKAQEANLTQVGQFFGTPAYMSPEQAEGQPVGPESDVYALGVMLYRMLAGVLPGKVPTGWNPLTTVQYVLSTPEPLRKLRPDCPAVLAELVHRMLTKDPRQRTLSAAQLQLELQAWGPTMAFARAAPAPRRGSTRMLVGAGIGLVVAGGLGVAAVLFAKPPPPPAPVVDAQAVREQRIVELVQRARTGEKAAIIDGAALELLKSGSDPRLSLARALARKGAQEWALVATYAEEARVLGEGTPVGQEAATLAAEAAAEQQKAAAAAAPVPAVAPAPAPAAAPAAAAKPAKAKKAAAEEEFPEY